MTQMLLTMTTKDSSVRSEAVGWSMDDSSLVVEGHIGMTPPSEEFYAFDCVLRAMNAGWKLLGPPIMDKNEYADWYLVKEAEEKVFRRRI